MLSDSGRKSKRCLRSLRAVSGLQRLRLRRLKFVQEQFFLAATAQNIKPLVRFLNVPTTGPATVAA
jgi:hypothetical protein